MFDGFTLQSLNDRTHIAKIPESSINFLSMKLGSRSLERDVRKMADDELLVVVAPQRRFAPNVAAISAAESDVVSRVQHGAGRWKRLKNWQLRLNITRFRRSRTCSPDSIVFV